MTTVAALTVGIERFEHEHASSFEFADGTSIRVDRACVEYQSSNAPPAGTSETAEGPLEEYLKLLVRLRHLRGAVERAESE